MSLKPRRARRGQATVELAVLMIVLVPLILYTLFLEDLLLYNLDWQEAIVTPAWDALPLDYPQLHSALDAAARVQGVNRKTFCDHSSAYDSYDPGFDCQDQIHHQALAAHQCWLAGGKQVTCSVERELGVVERTYHEAFGRGGAVSCTARLGVTNYFLPQRFLTWGKDVTDKKRFQGSVHGAATQATAANSWVFGAGGASAGASGDSEGADGTASDETGTGPADLTPSDDAFAVLHDPWAINHVETILPDVTGPDGHPFYDRVKHYYEGPPAPSGLAAAQAARAFAQGLQGAELLAASAAVADNALGDDPEQPNLAFISGDLKGQPGHNGKNYAKVKSNAGSFSASFVTCAAPTVDESGNIVWGGTPGGGPGNNGTPGSGGTVGGSTPPVSLCSSGGCGGVSPPAAPPPAPAPSRDPP